MARATTKPRTGIGTATTGYIVLVFARLTVGALTRAHALQQAGVIPDPADAATEDLRAELEGTTWQLVSIETSGAAIERWRPA